MPKYDVEAIAKAIKEAAAHAKAAADFEDWDDMGTCNFDQPYLSAKGMTKAQAAKVEELSGVGSSIGSFLGMRVLFIYGALEGQGNRRTKIAEDMKRELQAAGLDAGVYYQMD